MSMTHKLQSILAPMALTMLAVVLAGTLLAVTPAFRRVEDQHNQRLTSHAALEFTRQIESLDSLVLNHTSYESTYNFALDPVENPGFADIILSDSYFAFKQLSDVFIVGNSGEIIFGKSYDAATQCQIPFRAEICASLANLQSAASARGADAYVSGIIDTPQGCCMVAAHPITGNNPEGNTAGTLFMTRALDAALISDISEHTGLPVAFYSCLDANLPDDVKKAQQTLSASADPETVYSKAIDLKTTAGYALIYDINGNPVLVLQVLIPRDIYHTAIIAIHTYLAFIILFHITSIIVSSYLIRHYIISRVQKAADFTRHVKDTNDLSKRIAITGNDEIADLETSFNTMMDALEHTQAQLRLQQKNEEELRRTIESVTEAIATMDPDWNIINCNDASVRLFEYSSKQEIIGRNAMEFAAPCDIARIPEIISRIIEQGHSGIHEVHMLKSDGTTFLAEISGASVKNAEGALICFVTSSRDITERRNAETRLKAQHEIIERILATLPQAVLVVSAKERILLSNHAFYSMFNIRERDVKGKALSRFLPVKELESIISRALSEDKSSFHVDFGMEINGRKHTYSATAVSMPPQEALLLFADLTEIREKTEKLILNDRLASIGELAAGVAHELGSPLSSIIMFSELLGKQGLPPRAMEDIQTIESEAHRGADIIKDLLAFARKNNADKQKTDVSSILDAVLKLRSHEHKIKNITVVRNISRDLPEVCVDFTRMEQVFLNIIINAEQAMSGDHKKGTLTITASANENTVRISFADDGKGISEENKKYIFDPFFTTKPMGEGTGLGLSICYGIVRQHGGSLSVSSKEGDGATFILELPVAETPDTPQS